MSALIKNGVILTFVIAILSAIGFISQFAQNRVIGIPHTISTSAGLLDHAGGWLLNTLNRLISIKSLFTTSIIFDHKPLKTILVSILLLFFILGLTRILKITKYYNILFSRKILSYSWFITIYLLIFFTLLTILQTSISIGSSIMQPASFFERKLINENERTIGKHSLYTLENLTIENFSLDINNDGVKENFLPGDIVTIKDIGQIRLEVNGDYEFTPIKNLNVNSLELIINISNGNMQTKAKDVSIYTTYSFGNVIYSYYFDNAIKYHEELFEIKRYEEKTYSLKKLFNPLNDRNGVRNLDLRNQVYTFIFISILITLGIIISLYHWIRNLDEDNMAPFKYINLFFIIWCFINISYTHGVFGSSYVFQVVDITFLDNSKNIKFNNMIELSCDNENCFYLNRLFNMDIYKIPKSRIIETNYKTNIDIFNNCTKYSIDKTNELVKLVFCEFTEHENY